MRAVTQKIRLPITNLDMVVCGNGFVKQKSKHCALFPNTIRALVCGPSSCGKSNLMLTLLLDKNGLKFKNLYIYSKSLYQPKYTFLTQALHGIVTYYPFQNNSEVIAPNDAEKDSVIIFDDVSCGEQDKIREYFCMGRHRNIDCFYLTQSYTHVPKHLLRENASFIILFKQDDLNLKHVYHDHVGADMSFDRFRELCNACWNEKYGFITICKEMDIDKGRYRQDLDKYIVL